MTKTQNNLLRRQQNRAFEGMTLVEIMIVIVIMALIGAGAAVALLPQLDKARVEETTRAIQTIGSAVTLYRAENPSGCPSMDDLVEGQFLQENRRVQDAWDVDFEIDCDGRRVTITSAGPDNEFGTDDDIT